MPVQKTDPAVTQRIQQLPQQYQNLLFDMGQFHGFTPGDDMTPTIKKLQGYANDGTYDQRPGAESLNNDHINALSNLQNMLFNPQAPVGASIFDAPPKE